MSRPRSGTSSSSPPTAASRAPGSCIEKIDTVFRAQIPVDSQPICRAVVTDKDEEAGLIEVDLTITNEAGETRVLGTARFRL